LAQLLHVGRGWCRPIADLASDKVAEVAVFRGWLEYHPLLIREPAAPPKGLDALGLGQRVPEPRGEVMVRPAVDRMKLHDEFDAVLADIDQPAVVCHARDRS